ncbi:discoidin domain-containing protein [uncultured Paenibacillus sp.]|uniref:discoidin domain-containing protein n=1 Tax=uncultured Paenibacillus sp. TaxID=227322 RepID=UPI0028D0320F|nr:discoidin domain-containing protein [uncultured Paenibacillus sp.]
MGTVSMKRKVWFILLAVAVAVAVAAAGYFGYQAVSPSRAGVDELDVSGIDFSFKNGNTIVNFTTEQPGFCQVLLGTESGKYDFVAVESMPEGPHTEHYNVVENLKPGTNYFYRVMLGRTDGSFSQSKEGSFQTPQNQGNDTGENQAADTPPGTNIALSQNGGRIVGVSSNYGGAANDQNWGAQMAIDGDPATEWSSDGNGNNAWIEIGFDKTYQVTAVGFWTRTMGTSAEIKKLRVLSADGTELGTFDLQGPDKMQYFTLDTPATTESLRFEAAESSGGNTGAVEIEVFAADSNG